MDNSNYGFIYKTTCLINNKIYIGQTTKNKEIKYFGSGIKIYKAIRKYGQENFKREILKFVNNQNELNKWEQIYILKFNSTNDSIGYNIENKSFGKGRASKETCMKIRLSHLGNKYSLGIKKSEETKRNMSIAHKNRSIESNFRRAESNRGKKRSDESKIKMRNAQLGRKHTQETKDKIKLKMLEIKNKNNG